MQTDYILISSAIRLFELRKQDFIDYKHQLGINDDNPMDLYFYIDKESIPLYGILDDSNKDGLVQLGHIEAHSFKVNKSELEQIKRNKFTKSLKYSNVSMSSEDLYQLMNKLFKKT
jgi:hypothetical protein